MDRNPNFIDIFKGIIDKVNRITQLLGVWVKKAAEQTKLGMIAQIHNYWQRSLLDRDSAPIVFIIFAVYNGLILVYPIYLYCKERDNSLIQILINMYTIMIFVQIMVLVLNTDPFIKNVHIIDHMLITSLGVNLVISLIVLPILFSRLYRKILNFFHKFIEFLTSIINRKD